ncbi:NAD(P)H-dependent oxidoreductase [Halomicronema sp. CCY15110]|uniref:NAD(P)H-dependent oxidoreductase n=1 Tax=Halomicronema sp. CCY15110 TaxID=2767773 RepID=UPI001951EA08|nr:NAD(P)H-dependent oxidoreductase [Halomicronema sp. CCY15110]
MNILMIHAHHEPQSFSAALCQQAVTTLTQAGHTVVLSDLYAMGFDPVSDRRNFTMTRNPDYLKQQQEELHATEVSGFSPEIEAEIQKLEHCDALIFNFPLWWFGMPGILKGWCDRVLAMGRIYGGSKLYEGGIGQSTKRALVMLTTGGGPTAYDGWGVNPAMDQILRPIHHGIFWFNGFLPLDPFIAWSPVRVSVEQRAAYLQQLAQRLSGLFTETPRQLPPLADFPDFGHDTHKRFMVVIHRPAPAAATPPAPSADAMALFERWQRAGTLLVCQHTLADADRPAATSHCGCAIAPN